MVKKGFITLLSSMLFLLCTAQDLKLWYDNPAAKWTDALPIGNGRLGAMIFGGIEQDRIQFNEETLWTGEPRNYNKEGAYKYLPRIRKLLAEGKQKEAEDLAAEQFMGLKSDEGKRDEWIKEVTALKGLKGNPALPNFDDSKWKEIEVPTYEGWETVGYEGLDGALWFRTTFELPAAMKGKPLVLDLNRIREQDLTYVNGKLVGSMTSGDARRYTIAADVLKEGKNTIAVQVLNFFDKGGIAGYKDTSRHIGIYPVGEPKNMISLVKKWKFFVQNDNPPPVARFQADYQPFGDVYLDFKGVANATNYKRELDLNNALVRTTYSQGGVDYSREYLASQPNQVIVIHVKASKPGNINFNAILNSPHKLSSTKKLNANTLALNVQVRHGALKGVSHLQVITNKGTANINGNKIEVRNADEVTLYIAAGTNYKTYKDVTADPLAIVKRSLESVKGKSYADVKAVHTREYQQYFNTFSVNFGKRNKDNIPTDERLRQFAKTSDPAFVALYTQYGRYLLISSSRPGTRPANLQGIWNDLLSPPWGSKYTTNINAEMNYWPAELLNLSAMHEPFFKMVEELAEAGKQTAKEYYNANGWVLHHNTDVWRGTAPINASNHGIWVTGGAWVSQHLWEHYLFTQDKEFLRKKAYPVMKQAALFFNDFLIKDEKAGWLISTPSNSPEQGGLVAGPTMDHQIIRSLYKAAAEASAILNVDNNLRAEWQQKQQQLAPNKIGKHGQLQEWLQDFDDPKNNHRHVSHLWAVYPGSEINFDANENMMKAARQSLLYRGDAATGWSLGWKINLWARFKDGDHAYKLIQMLLSPAEGGGAGSYVNLFDAHPPFQIDGNFGGAAGIGELLVQSHTQYIDLLPALPSALPDGEVKGICARGGFVLTLNWSKGKLMEAEILSIAGNDAVLRYAGKTVTIKTVKGKSYKLNGKLQVL